MHSQLNSIDQIKTKAMEFKHDLRPRQLGRTEAIIQDCKVQLESGLEVSLMSPKKDEKLLARYQDRLRELGVETEATELTSSWNESIWDNHPYEPCIIGFRTITTFNGWKLKKV